MSETPPDVDNPGYVKPGTGQTEKGEDRNESTAPDGSTKLDASSKDVLDTDLKPDPKS